MARLPSILRRQLRLHQARRALLRGDPEEALGILGDPCLVVSAHAEWIRSRTLEMLCRRALRKSHEGRDASTARLVEMIDSEDPERADRLRRRLQSTEDPSPARPVAASDPTLALQAVRALLADLRRSGEPPREPAAPEAGYDDRPDSARSAGHPAEAGHVPARARPSRFAQREHGRLVRLAVDDGGESLLARGTEFVLGHLRSESADLPFLADVEREHARLSRVESFHGGPRWCLEANGAVEVDGRAVAPGAPGLTLVDGQEVRLARNLAFRFRLPDPSSSSAALELLRGAECLGAGRILLCVPGDGGRLRVGPGVDRHIGVGALEQDLELRFDEGRLVLRCAAGLHPSAPIPGSVSNRVELSLPWPLPVAIDLAVGRASAKRPPFGVALRPMTEPRLPAAEPTREETA